MNNLEILYQDEWLVAINKPAGLLVHRSALDKYTTRVAVQVLRDQIGQKVYPIHRLDRPTSGVLLFALNGATVATMQRNWELKTTKKYQALVRGWVQGSGLIDYALRYQPDKIAEQHKREDIYQSAHTYYQCRQKYALPFAVGRYATARYSLVDLWPGTGRKHQLRRHMAHLRHPIVADTSHGDGKHNAFMKTTLGCTALALSCVQLRFFHPENGHQVVITSERSENFNHCLTQMSQLSESG